MAQLEQRVNFYQAQFRKAEIRFPFSQMVALWVLLLVLLLAVTGVDRVRMDAQRDKVEKLQVRQRQMEKTVQQLDEQLAQRVTDPLLQRRVTELRQTLQEKQEFLAHLQAQGSQQQTTYSGVLDGLAQQSRSALWLTRIRLRSPGPTLALDGLATRADAVPEYLATLHQVAVFDGMEFRNVTVERQKEQGRYLIFNVSAFHDEPSAN